MADVVLHLANGIDNITLSNVASSFAEAAQFVQTAAKAGGVWADNIFYPTPWLWVTVNVG